MFRYHGGKWTSRKKILKYMRTPHTVFFSWMTGGGSIEASKERVHTEVWNDRWSLVTNVYQVLRNRKQAEKLQRLLKITPYSRDEWNAINDINFHEVKDPVELARITLFRSFAGFGSASTNPDYSTGFRGSSKRSGSGPATDWKNYTDHIPSFTERLQGVCIENRHYRKLCYQHDSEDTLHYLDPPYVLGTRNTNGPAYAFEMTDADHVDLLNHATQMKGQVIISAYENDIYNDLLKEWTKTTFEALADGSKKRIEVLWLNPKCAELQKIRTSKNELTLFQ